MDKYTVRNSDGSVDVAASANKYSVALTQWVFDKDAKRQAKTEVVPNEAVESAVESILDNHPKRITTPALVNQVAIQLNPSLDKYTAVTNQVRAYIKEQVASGRLNVQSRRGGGIMRMAKPGEPIPTPVDSDSDSDSESAE